MTVKKQPESESGKLYEAANDWFRQFLKHLELFMVELGQELPVRAGSSEYRLAAIRAVKLTLLDSGINEEQVIELLGRVALEGVEVPRQIQWNAELNKRRFELIDGDIQGKLSRKEQLELAWLTQIMRQHVESEVNLPLEGAKELHRRLIQSDPKATGS